MSNFYIIGTPIGNLEDITYRAVRVLKEVDLILCENVLEASKLLRHFEITTATTNYFANSKLSKIDKVIDLLKSGKDVALISDAGMPTISDPGSLLISKLYEAKDKGLEVEIKVIPGPTALISALSLSGFTGNQFTFFGFLPQKKGRNSIFIEMANNERISIFYESVHRVMKCFESLMEVLDKDRQVVVARELTKMFEEVVRGNIFEVLNYFKDNPEKVRGEFVIVIDKK